MDAHYDVEAKQETHDPNGLRSNLVICPNCKNESPKTLYCLNCGYPLYYDEDEHPKAEEEGARVVVEEDYVREEAERMIGVPMEAEAVPLPVADEPHEEEAFEEAEEEFVEPSEALAWLESVEEEEGADFEPEEAPEVLEESETPVEEGEAPVVETEEEVMTWAEPEERVHVCEPDHLVREVMENLAKSISLKLWLVNMLCEGKVEEGHFLKLFEGYEFRSELYMNQRNEMLERDRDLAASEKVLNEARVGLQELEMRKVIRDISDDEYDAKAPAYKWDIDHYEHVITKRKREVEFLEDLSRVMPKDEIVQLKEIADNCRGEIDRLESSSGISPGTTEKVRKALEEAIACLEGFGYV